MSCVKCSDGSWQCSSGADPCGMSPEMGGEVTGTETRCYYIYTKKAGGDCHMRIKDQPDPNPGEGWEDAGHICFQFDVLEDAKTHDCYVRVTPLP